MMKLSNLIFAAALILDMEHPAMAQNLTHWEFSFTLHPGHLEKVPHVVNERTFMIDAGLNKHQATQLREKFLHYKVSGTEDGMEGYVLYRDDNESLRFRMWGLDDYAKVNGIPVELVVKELNDPDLRLILDVAQSANLIFTDNLNENVRFIGEDPNPLQLERWPGAGRIDTIADLRFWLEDTVGGRRVYTDDDFND